MKTRANGPHPQPTNNRKEDYVRATQFQAINFFDPAQQRQVVLLYALGEDGIVREFRGTEKEWLPFPIKTGG
jgi:hypothetical protein